MDDVCVGRAWSVQEARRGRQAASVFPLRCRSWLFSGWAELKKGELLCTYWNICSTRDQTKTASLCVCFLKVWLSNIITSFVVTHSLSIADLRVRCMGSTDGKGHQGLLSQPSTAGPELLSGRERGSALVVWWERCRLHLQGDFQRRHQQKQAGCCCSVADTPNMHEVEGGVISTGARSSSARPVFHRLGIALSSLLTAELPTGRGSRRGPWCVGAPRGARGWEVAVARHPQPERRCCAVLGHGIKGITIPPGRTTPPVLAVKWKVSSSLQSRCLMTCSTPTERREALVCRSQWACVTTEFTEA